MRPLQTVLFIVPVSTLLALATHAQVVCPPGEPPRIPAELPPQGIYTDRPSYEPGDNLEVHGNWDGEIVRYRLLKVGGFADEDDGPLTNWTIIDEGPEVSYGPLLTPDYGSFVYFPGVGGKEPLSVSGRTDFTIEGWFKPTFLFAPTNFVAGSIPRSVAIADLNGDMNLDLAVANVNSGNVSILLGNGAGGFNAPTNFPVGPSPRSVAIADLDGDMNPDLAVANDGSDDVSILLGDGFGGFSPPTNFGVGDTPRSVAIGHLDNDMDLDLAVANVNSDNVSILLGDGAGGFSGPTNFGAGDFPFSVAIGDLNDDMKPDLAVANVNSDNVSILLGDGVGGFSGPTNFGVGDAPRSVAIADLNGDMKPDLAVANSGSDDVSILSGDGAGGFSGPTNLAAGDGPFSVAIGDLNGDMNLDLAVASLSSNVSILDPGETFPTENIALAGQMSSDPAESVAGIVITPDRKLQAFVRTTGETLTVTSTESVELDEWCYVAATWRSRTLRLFRANIDASCDDPCVDCVNPCVELIAGPLSAPAYPNLLRARLPVPPLPPGSPPSAVTSDYLEFRIGARSDAPGDMKGCFTGRLDQWGVWPVGLTRKRLQTRVNETLDAPITCCPTASLAGYEALASLTFEDPLLQGLGVYIDNTADGQPWPKVQDFSGSGAHGYIFNHGTPGVAGVSRDGQGLRLNHDQVFDAGFPSVPIPLPSSCDSGLYAIQAVFKDGGTYSPTSAENLRADHFTSFVVKPGSCDKRDIAMIFPTNTWMAYNSWPGVHGEAKGYFSAGGLTQRRREIQGSLVTISQGGNGIYSGAVFSSWRRPNLEASPVLGNLTEILLHCGPEINNNGGGAVMNARAIEWLRQPRGGVLTGAQAFDAYADVDLDLGIPGLNEYKLVIVSGHHEYWSQRMLDAVHLYLDDPANKNPETTNLINIGGNAIIWRSEIADMQGNLVLEAEKWPNNKPEGTHDSISLLAGDGNHDQILNDSNRTGYWRMLEQIRGTHKDYVLGTLQEVATGFTDAPASWGTWGVLSAGSALWGSGVTENQTFPYLDAVVSGEADGFIEGGEFRWWQYGPGDPPCFIPAMGPMPGTIVLNCTLPLSIPLPADFPFKKPGTDVVVLGEGVGRTSSFRSVWWCHKIFTATSHDEVEEFRFAHDVAIDPCNLNPGPCIPPQGFVDCDSQGLGNIVYYEHRGGGRVLSVSSIHTPRALIIDEDSLGMPLTNELSALVERMLDCALNGKNCP